MSAPMGTGKTRFRSVGDMILRVVHQTLRFFEIPVSSPLEVLEEKQLQPSEPDELFPLTEDDIIERLRIADENLVNAIYSFSKEMFAWNTRVWGEIDRKATTWIGFGGSLATLTLGGGSLLIDSLNIGDTSKGAFLAAIGLLVVIIVLLLVVISYASGAAFVRGDWRTPAEVEVFERDILDRQADLEYKRHMTAHVWKVYRNNYRICNQKSHNLRVAQKYFLFAMFAVAAFGLLMLGYIIHTKDVFA